MTENAGDVNEILKVPLVILTMALSFGLRAEDMVIEKATAALQELTTSDIKIDSIQATPIDGIYQIVVGADVLYMTDDAQFLFKGELLDLSQKLNLTEDVRSLFRKRHLQSLGEKDYIEFASVGEASQSIYVFTDVDCGYCRKLHVDVPILNKNSISVRYLAYPRSGVESPTGKTMQAIWCATDRQQALTNAKNNQDFEREDFEGKSCQSKIAEQYELGGSFGVRGTPSIYLENGKSLPGYMPPDQLIQEIRG